MLENEKQITIVDEQGNEHLMQVLFTYDNEERKTLCWGITCEWIVQLMEASDSNYQIITYQLYKYSVSGFTICLST